MKPYWTDGAITIYHGDCREILLALEAGSVQTVITDPPFGAVTHAGARSNSNDHHGFPEQRVAIDFAPMSASEVADVLEDLTLRLCIGWVVATIDWRHALELERRGLLVRLGVWIKPNAMPQMTGDRPGTGWEAVAVCHRPGKKSWNGGGGAAVWNFGTSRYGNFGPSLHPTEKPLPLIATWIKQFNAEGGLILDPFMGSGTTLRAAKDAGLSSIGVEICEAYCEIAAKRMEQGVFDWSEP